MHLVSEVIPLVPPVETSSRCLFDSDSCLCNRALYTPEANKRQSFTIDLRGSHKSDEKLQNDGRLEGLEYNIKARHNYNRCELHVPPPIRLLSLRTSQSNILANTTEEELYVKFNSRFNGIDFHVILRFF